MERVWSHDESKDGVVLFLEPNGAKYYLCVHRNILSARSRYFERKFYSDESPVDRVMVYVSSIRCAVDMVRYMYALHPNESPPFSSEHVETARLFEIPEYMSEIRKMSDTESKRRYRNRTLFHDWRSAYPEKRKIGDREEVFTGNAFCTRSGFVKSDLCRRDNGSLEIIV